MEDFYFVFIFATDIQQFKLTQMLIYKRKATNLFLAFVVTTICLGLCSCSEQKKRYVIGVSQCSTDIWRDKQNAELKVGAYMHDNVELIFSAAHDNDMRQIQQIDSLVAQGIDLLIVAPNHISKITPAIDHTYDSGIPVVVFERKPSSNKYTASSSADNYEIGDIMGDHIATKLNGKGNIIEIQGLEGSSPAIDRHSGFLHAINMHPELHMMASLQGDWTKQSAYNAMSRWLQSATTSQIENVSYIFAHNDRMAMGARQALIEFLDEHHLDRPLPLFCGIDGLSGKNGGINLVCDSILDATYIYPTAGDELLELALNILEHKPYKKENLQITTLVTHDNADALLMQAEEINRQSKYLEQLHNQVGTYINLLNYQRLINLYAYAAIALLLLTLVIAYLYYHQRIRLNKEREQIARDRLNFYTLISHRLRTPLTLIEGPLHQLIHSDTYKNMDASTKEMVGIMDRNTNQLSKLINQILDGVIEDQDITDIIITDDLPEPLILQPSPVEESYERATLLIVDDNADIRHYLRNILKEKYDIIEAADGYIGLKQARSEVPDLIISDVMMPNMNGLQFCQSIKNDIVTSHIPVILLTARAMNHHQIEGYEHGADAYLSKPFDEHLLLSRIANLLQSRRQLKRIFEEQHNSSNGHTQMPASPINQQDLRESAFLRKLNDIINEHLNDSTLSIEELGNYMVMSRVQLYRKVKAITGYSPVEVVRKQRLLRAHTLLQSTDKTISEIAYEVGFADPSYFTKCFKDEYGMLPGEVRK